MFITSLLNGECYEGHFSLSDMGFSPHTHIRRVYSKMKVSGVANTCMYTISNGRICLGVLFLISPLKFVTT